MSEVAKALGEGLGVLYARLSSRSPINMASIGRVRKKPIASAAEDTIGSPGPLSEVFRSTGRPISWCSRVRAAARVGAVCPVTVCRRAIDVADGVECDNIPNGADRGHERRHVLGCTGEGLLAGLVDQATEGVESVAA